MIRDKTNGSDFQQLHLLQALLWMLDDKGGEEIDYSVRTLCSWSFSELRESSIIPSFISRGLENLQCVLPCVLNLFIYSK